MAQYTLSNVFLQNSGANQIQRNNSRDTFDTRPQLGRIAFVFVKEGYFCNPGFDFYTILENRNRRIIEDIPNFSFQFSVGELGILAYTHQVYAPAQARNTVDTRLHSTFYRKATYEPTQIDNTLPRFNHDIFAKSIGQAFQTFSNYRDHFFVGRIFGIARIAHKNEHSIIHLYNKFVLSIVFNHTNGNSKLFTEHMIDMVPKQRMHTLRRQKPVSLRRHFMFYSYSRSFVLFF